MEVGAGDTLHPDSHRAPGPAAATATGAPSFHPNATHAPRPKARESFLKQCRSSLSAAIQSRVAAICYRHGLYCATHPFLIIYVTFLAFLICTYPAMNSFEKVLAKRAALAAASPSGRTLFGLSLDWQQHGLPGLAAVGAAVGALPLLGALVPADWRTPAIPNVFPAPAPGSADPEAIATLTRDAYSHGSYLRIDPVVFRTGDCCQGEWRPVPGEGATSASSASWVGSGDGGGWAGPITEAGTGTNADPACTDGGLLDTARLLSVLRFQSAVEQFLLLPDAASPVEDLLSLSTEDPAADPIRPSSATTGFRDICWRASSDPSRCLIHTPLEFWLSDAGRLLADGDIRGTVARRDARSSFGSLIEAGSLFGGLSGAAAPSDGRSTSPAAGASGWSRAASVQLTFLSMVRHEQAGLVDNFWHSFWQRSLSGDFSPSVPLGRPEPEATDTPECDATLPAALFQDDGLTLPAGHALLGAPGPARVHRLGQTNRFLYSYPNSPAGGARQHAGGPDGGALQRLLAGRMYLLEAAIIFLSYLLVYVYVSLMLGRVELVKSKFGLAFSALMIVFASLIMSIGVCSLLGYELGLLPWELLSFLVLAIGLESTFALTNAVTATPCDLPVKERVGRGLGSAGVSILRNLVLELVLMALGGFFNIQALTEFCMFTAVAVIINFFIHMSFFATVLSIDIRRLELSDLHNPRMDRFLQHGGYPAAGGPLPTGSTLNPETSLASMRWEAGSAGADIGTGFSPSPKHTPALAPPGALRPLLRPASRLVAALPGGARLAQRLAAKSTGPIQGGSPGGQARRPVDPFEHPAIIPGVYIIGVIMLAIGLGLFGNSSSSSSNSGSINPTGALPTPVDHLLASPRWADSSMDLWPMAGVGSAGADLGSGGWRPARLFTETVRMHLLSAPAGARPDSGAGGSSMPAKSAPVATPPDGSSFAGWEPASEVDIRRFQESGTAFLEAFHRWLPQPVSDSIWSVANPAGVDLLVEIHPVTLVTLSARADPSSPDRPAFGSCVSLSDALISDTARRAGGRPGGAAHDRRGIPTTGAPSDGRRSASSWRDRASWTGSLADLLPGALGGDGSAKRPAMSTPPSGGPGTGAGAGPDAPPSSGSWSRPLRLLVVWLLQAGAALVRGQGSPMSGPASVRAAAWVSALLAYLAPALGQLSPLLAVFALIAMLIVSMAVLLAVVRLRWFDVFGLLELRRPAVVPPPWLTPTPLAGGPGLPDGRDGQHVMPPPGAPVPCSQAQSLALRGHQADVTAFVAFRPPQLAFRAPAWALRRELASNTGAQAAWDLGHLPAEEVACAEWLAASASLDRTLRVWDPTSGVQLVCYRLPSPAWHLAAADRLLFSGHGDGAVFCLDATGGGLDAGGSACPPRSLLPPGGGAITGLVVSARAQLLVAGAAGGLVSVWTLPELRCLVQIPHPAGVTCLDLGPDGLLAVGLASGSIHLYHLQGHLPGEDLRRPLRVLHGHTTPVTALSRCVTWRVAADESIAGDAGLGPFGDAASSSGAPLPTSSRLPELARVRAALAAMGTSPEAATTGKAAPPASSAASAIGGSPGRVAAPPTRVWLRVVSGAKDGEVRRWCTETGECLSVHHGHARFPVRQLHLDESLGTLVTTAEDETVLLCDLGTFRTVRRLANPGCVGFAIRDQMLILGPGVVPAAPDAGAGDFRAGFRVFELARGRAVGCVPIHIADGRPVCLARAVPPGLVAGEAAAQPRRLAGGQLADACAECAGGVPVRVVDAPPGTGALGMPSLQPGRDDQALFPLEWDLLDPSIIINRLVVRGDQLFMDCGQRLVVTSLPRLAPILGVRL